MGEIHHNTIFLVSNLVIEKHAITNIRKIIDFVNFTDLFNYVILIFEL